MRRVLKKIANNDSELGDISTMADSSVVEVTVRINISTQILFFLRLTLGLALRLDIVLR